METSAILSIDTVRAAFEAVCPHERYRPADAVRSDAPFTTPTDHLETDHVRLPLTGLTYFYRHENLSTALAQSLRMAASAETPVRILAAPSSIGCEAYTLSVLMQQNGFDDGSYAVEAFDISEKFTRIARGKTYPVAMLRDIAPDKRAALFDAQDSDNGFVHIRENIANNVRFLAPGAFEKFSAPTPYDVVMVNNMFVYMNDTQMRDTIRVVRDVCRDAFVFLNKTNGGDLSYFVKRPDEFIDIADHPRWKDTPLAAFIAQQPRNGYAAWARLDA